MKFSIIYIEKNVVRIPIFIREGFCFFKADHTLKKTNLDWVTSWVSDPLNYGLIVSMNVEFIFVYQFEELYVIDRGDGIIVRAKNISFFPIEIGEEYIWGEEVINNEKYLSKYNIKSDKLDLFCKIPVGYYCNSIHKYFAVIVDKINFNFFYIMSLLSGEKIWEYRMSEICLSLNLFFFNNILIARFDNGTYSAFDLFTGTQIWHKSINIDAFDEEKGLIYVLENDFIVIDATTGEEVIRVKDWSKKQLEKYPALFFGGSPCSLSEEYIVFASRATFDEFGEGGIFFIDKETAEVKEYFRIVFDKDPVQRTEWSGNKIPDDQQIPFMPLDKPIYKNGRLYVLLPSPIEGQKDLYIYEKE